MRRYNVTEGTRAQILAELDQYGSDRAQQGKEDKARHIAKAIALLGKGSDGAWIGNSHYYKVVDEADAEPR